jgi:hypothetical protein
MFKYKVFCNLLLHSINNKNTESVIHTVTPLGALDIKSYREIMKTS